MAVWQHIEGQGGQSLPGLGDVAVHADGRLTFEKNRGYGTVEAPNVDATVDNGQQVTIKNQVALDVLSRLG